MTKSLENIQLFLDMSNRMFGHLVSVRAHVALHMLAAIFLASQ
jgi:hypothetical protein